MSSRRLLVLLQHLPEESAFKTALRDGEWPRQDVLLAALYNELHAMRGDGYGEGFSYRPVLSPSMERAKNEKRSIVREAHDNVIAQLRGS